jgi:general secretion pathway protein G
LFELVIVIVIAVVLMALFLDRARFYQEQAEKTAMEGIVATVQSALVLQYGQLMTRGQAADVAALVRDNPVNWLQKKPRNYLGEFYDVSAAKLETGSWAFDLKTRELVYLVRNGQNLKMEGRKLIRFHVAQQHEASRLPSMQNAPPELTGLLFEPVVPYTWFEPL